MYQLLWNIILNVHSQIVEKKFKFYLAISDFNRYMKSLRRLIARKIRFRGIVRDILLPFWFLSLVARFKFAAEESGLKAFAAHCYLRLAWVQCNCEWVNGGPVILFLNREGSWIHAHVPLMQNVCWRGGGGGIKAYFN